MVQNYFLITIHLFQEHSLTKLYFLIENLYLCPQSIAYAVFIFLSFLPSFLFSFFLVLGFVCFQTGFYYVAQASLELTILFTLTSRVVGFTDMSHHVQLTIHFSFKKPLFTLYSLD
jgi:hypothetical protein